MLLSIGELTLFWIEGAFRSRGKLKKTHGTRVFRLVRASWKELAPACFGLSHLGAILDHFRANLGPSESHLGDILGHLGPFEGILDQTGGEENA